MMVCVVHFLFMEKGAIKTRHCSMDVQTMTVVQVYGAQQKLGRITLLVEAIGIIVE